VLDPEAAAVLAYLDRLTDTVAVPSGALAAHIDRYGIVRSTIRLDGGAELFLQGGDGWDRVVCTCPSRRVYEWIWRKRQTPEDVDALLAGRGVESTAWLGKRLAGARLMLEGRTLATAEGNLRVALLRRLGIRLRERNDPAL
jgi:hypothetical protein